MNTFASFKLGDSDVTVYLEHVREVRADECGVAITHKGGLIRLPNVTPSELVFALAQWMKS